MATINRFEDLEIWQNARKLSKEIIQISVTTDLKNDYKLKNQIKSSSGSIMDNIAEGFERDGNIEFRQFLSIAKGSSGETRSQLYRTFDSGYIAEDQMKSLVDEYEQLSKRIASFISYLNKKDYKGIKFK
jgi:four helix bundle protein